MAYDPESANEAPSDDRPPAGEIGGDATVDRSAAGGSPGRPGDPRAAGDLLPIVYEELRKLASARLAAEPPGRTLQPTALVHEAYLRLVGSVDGRRWEDCGHFFAAAAEAMRRILIEAARRKGRLRHGGGRRRVELDDVPTAIPDEDLLALNDALARLEERDPGKAALVKLRYFAGLTTAQAAAALDISVATAERRWAFARAWLHAEINGPAGPDFREA